MEPFRDRVAIVTGGASGIGRALGQALARRGAEVVLADVQGDRVRAVAEAIVAAGGRASGVALDVCDAAAVRSLVEETARDRGRLDFLFNNAGIAINGEARDLALDDWNRILDVNLRGVIHGVVAAYPLMLARGGGHIVNTASLAGLIPAPGLAPYAATKHAVVGLSLSLRAEGADLGVRVSAVCPGFIDTAIIDESRYVNLDSKSLVDEIRPHMMSADRCAEHVLRGVERNLPIITVTALAKVAWLLYRISPRLVDWLAPRMFRRTRRHRREPASDERAAG